MPRHPKDYDDSDRSRFTYRRKQVGMRSNLGWARTESDPDELGDEKSPDTERRRAGSTAIRGISSADLSAVA
jgi:hypothetical protein